MYWEALYNHFEAEAKPEQAAKMAAYMKGLFPFYGIKSPERRLLFRAFLKEAGKPNREDLPEVIREAWAYDEREFQYVGMDLLQKYEKKLPAEYLEEAHYLITHKSWWDTVDWLASHIVGGIVLRNPSYAEQMDEWISDDNMWIQRTALLHQLRFKEQTDAERLFDYCSQLAHSSEFFIRKAIGWALREYAKVQPEAVRKFVQEQQHELSGLSKREALKHIG